MKTLLIAFSLLFAFTIGSVEAADKKDNQVSEVRKVEAFSSIEVISVDVDCDYLCASIEGVGSVKLSGTAGKADVSKEGIGSVNTRNLKIGK